MIKILSSKLLKKRVKNNLCSTNRYILTIEMSDRDVEMFEDYATVYTTKGTSPECDTAEPYLSWIKKVWHEIWKNTWRKYD